LPKDSRAVATQLIGRAVLRACVELFEASGIRVMPLKGIWLQELVYGESLDRSISDVDVLVPSGQYKAARQLLVRAGWRLRSQNESESAYEHPELPLPLDLHARLFTPGAFRVSEQHLFGRGRPDGEVFGVTVWLPDPLDVFAHLVGHALKSGNAWRGTGHELRDIPRLAATQRLSASACAEHLQELGLARAARFVLPLTAAVAERPFGGSTVATTAFVSELLTQLGGDPVGAALCQAAMRLRTRASTPGLATSLVGFALDSSLWRGMYALSLRTSAKLVAAAHEPTPCAVSVRR
jgi:Uncharacterised nucleotidyltransferase